MTSISGHGIICPTCLQQAILLFRPKEQDYILVRHDTMHGIKCTSIGKVYSKESAKRLFRVQEAAQ